MKVVNGARLSEESTWSDDLEGDDAARIMKWNIKLIDFGFARALRPDDIIDENNYTLTTKKEDLSGFAFGTVDNQLDDDSIHRSSYGGKGTPNKRESRSTKRRENINSTHQLDLSSSISRIRVRALSAVGNRNYVAPEIINDIRIFKRRGTATGTGTAGDKKNKNNDNNNNNKNQLQQKEEPLAEYVSDYGMIVDAFSTGATIRYMCLGIPPQTSVDDFWQEKNSLLRVVGRKVKKIITKKDSTNGSTTTTTKKRKKKYRSNNDLPPETVRLILGLTHWNAKQRTTVRSARSYDWITSSYSMKQQKSNSNSNSSSNEEHNNSQLSKNHGVTKLDFLNCAMEKQEH